jgi:hypothetical protein
MGLISPIDHQQTRYWLDHVLAEMLKLCYVRDVAVGGITTLVTGMGYETRTGKGAGESTAGLATLAKVLGKL